MMYSASDLSTGTALRGVTVVTEAERLEGDFSRQDTASVIEHPAKSAFSPVQWGARLDREPEYVHYHLHSYTLL